MYITSKFVEQNLTLALTERLIPGEKIYQIRVFNSMKKKVLKESKFGL